MRIARFSLWTLGLVAAAASPAPAMGQLHIPASDLAPARRNAIYLEIGGAGGAYSINLDRRFGARGIGRFGATSWDFTNFDNERRKVNAAIVGAGRLFDLSEFLGRDGRWIEAGADVAAGRQLHERYKADVGSGGFVLLVPYAGLRYQRPRGRWMSRIDFTPYLPLAGDNPYGDSRKATASGGLAFGYVF